ncbi:MAG: T9SS type A sorting domain-containing protein [Bacteroidetes bacterium]|nr:T9SS type A sorting domain-containing protein [Bacteroidota bacterium]
MNLNSVILFLCNSKRVENLSELVVFRMVFFYFLCCFSYSHVKAQVLTSNNIQATILSGTQVSVKGDVLITNGATIDNTGIIDISGNWTNNSSASVFGISKGTVILNGVNQQINGAFPTTFFNLNLFNGIKTMNTDITTGGMVSSPSGSLNCNNAILDLNSHTAIIHNINPAGITASTGFILSEDADNSSKVWWEFVGQGLHTIPFGNSSGSHVPFSFLPLPSMSGGVFSDMVVSTYATNAANIPYPVLPETVTHMNGLAGIDNSNNTVDRFWHISKNGSADCSFTYAPGENAAAGNANMRAQRWEKIGEGWELPTLGQSNPTAQSVFVPALVTNGTYTIAAQSSPLPVSLLYFEAKKTDFKSVICSWVTASETGNNYFEVERSRDGIYFSSIGIVAGAGNSSLQLTYTFTDLNPLKGISYYRLKQTDFNGAFQYSEWSVISFDALYTLAVYPNPSKGNFTIQLPYENSNSGAIIQITNASGMVVYREQVSSDLNMINLTNKEIANGIYTVTAIYSQEFHQIKINLIR